MSFFPKPLWRHWGRTTILRSSDSSPIILKQINPTIELPRPSSILSIKKEWDMGLVISPSNILFDQGLSREVDEMERISSTSSGLISRMTTRSSSTVSLTRCLMNLNKAKQLFHSILELFILSMVEDDHIGFFRILEFSQSSHNIPNL